MKAEVDSGERSEAPPRSANTTPKKPKSSTTTPKRERIIGGRVGKSSGTPSKKRGSFKGIKEEPDSRYVYYLHIFMTPFVFQNRLDTYNVIATVALSKFLAPKMMGNS